MTTTEAATVNPESATDAADTRINRALLMVASVVVLGATMSILDTTVVNVAINTLAEHFHTTLPTIQWVATGYTLALATVIPLTGWIADRFGTKRLYMGSIAMFVIGSCLSGLAWSSTSIILFRVLQGLGGGMIMPAGMTILTRAAGPQRLGRVMAIMGVPLLLGPILGPILGGWLVADVSWRWIFFINLPIGICALMLSSRVLPTDVPGHEERLDLLGFLLVSPGLALIIYGLAETSTSGGFRQAKVLVPLVVGLCMLAMFVWHALRIRNPLIDVGLFKHRTFATSSLSLTLMCISVFGAFLLLPLYFQAVRGESPLMSGLLLVPQGVGSMIGMPIAGYLSDRTGSGRIVPFGMLAVIAAVLWLTQIGAHTSYVAISLDLFIFGIGMGFTMMPIFTGAMQSVTGAAAARASTALNILQQTGASIGTAVLSVILATELADQLGHGSHGTIGASSAASAAERAHIAEPMATAFGNTFWYALGLLVIAFLASLSLPKHRPSLPEVTEASAAMLV
jgi:EmrB/QacA subfamily drug resistance transporter